MTTLYPDFVSTLEREPENAQVPSSMEEYRPIGDCDGMVYEVYWYHPNYLGSVDLVSTLSGHVHQFFMYTPWGESMYEYSAQTTLGTFDSPFRFNGKELDKETGYSYYGARYYQSKLSMWLSVDPLAHKYPHMSPYAFTGNNPVMLVDPDGREHEPPTRPGQCEGDTWFDPETGTSYEWDGKGSWHSDMQSDSPTLLNEGEITASNQPFDFAAASGGKNSGINQNNEGWENSKMALDFGGQFFGALETTVRPGNHWLGNNGKFYNLTWGGNQHTGSRSGAFNAANNYKWAGRATIGVSALIGVAETYNGIQIDGGQFGYNAQSAAVKATGNLIGGWAGAEAGAWSFGIAGGLIGGPGGAIIGAIIGGFVGGLGGGYIGGNIGIEAVNSYHRR